jgi:Uma2 family endonuclease
MSTVTTDRRYTVEEYLELEARSEERHEYWHGQLVAMAGGTLNHDRIAEDIRRLLGNQLVDSRHCEVFSGDVRVKADARSVYTYPDVTIACDAKQERIAGVETLVNPIVIFEVLSDSTEGRDHGKKLAQYMAIASLREYFLVSQVEVRIDHFVRIEEGWRFRIHTETTDVIRLESLPLTLTLSDVYRRVEFPQPEEETNK